MAQTLTRSNARILAPRNGLTFADLDDFEEAAPTTPVPPPQPVTSRITGKPKPQPHIFIRGRNNPHTTETFVMSTYAQSLITVGAEKFVELTDNIENAPFKNKNLERDTFLARTLYAHNYQPKAAAAAIEKQMQTARVPQLVIAATIEQLCYSVLKNAMFTAFINYRQAIRASDGSMPDSFFEQFARAPAPENCESEDDDVKLAPIDPREEDMDAPSGLAQTHITLNGVEFALDDIDGVPARVVEGLEDARLHLENIIQAYNRNYKGRLAFFVTQDRDGKWIRHDGSAAMALLDFELKMETRNKAKAGALDAFYARENQLARAAA